jgi:NAD(P)-dependent dehydrogenase (short-subunit alcohol dehydrogenase family)
MRTGRIVVVTGAAGGIGRPIVSRFLANGDTVVATDRDAPALHSLARQQVDGAPLHVIVGDVSDEADCAAISNRARALGERVDVLVSVAGWYPIQPFDALTATDFRRVVDVNLTGPFLIARSIEPLMRGNGWGRIVLVGSASTFVGVPDQLPYASAKAGLAGLTRSLARAVGPDGITVNLVTPGLTLTAPVLATMSKAMRDAAIAARALPRAEQPEDLVGAVFFLASPDADFITGQTLNVDGGSHMV